MPQLLYPRRLWAELNSSRSSVAKRPAYPNHVGTIGEKIRMGHGLWDHCENRECLHRARIR